MWPATTRGVDYVAPEPQKATPLLYTIPLTDVTSGQVTPKLIEGGQVHLNLNFSYLHESKLIT